MPLLEWINSNLHNDNQDWIIKKIKNVEKAETNTAASETAAAGSAARAAISQEEAAASETSAAESATAAENYYRNISDNVGTLVTGWMDEHITPTTPPVDDSLTISGAAADAQVTGNKIRDLEYTVGIDTLVLELGRIAMSGGHLDYTDSNYGARTPANIVISVNKGDTFILDASIRSAVSAVTIYDKSEPRLIAAGAALANGYTFEQSFTDVAITFSTFSSLVNVDMSVASIRRNAGRILYYNNKIAEIEDSAKTAASILFNRENYKTVYSDYTVENGYYRSTDGTYVEHNDWKSYVIDLSDIFAFRVHSWKYGTGTYSYIVKNASDDVVAHGVLGTVPPSEWDEVIEIPAGLNATQLIIIASSAYTTEIYTFGEYSIPSGKKYIAFGDSVCRGNHPDATKSANAWPEAFGNWKKISASNLAIAGQGYMTTQYAVKALETISASNISDADLISLAFGINDASDSSLPIGTANDTTGETILGCVYQCISYIYAHNPTVQLVICGTTKQNGIWGARLAQINEGLKAICEKYGVAFVDMSDSPINQFNGLSGGSLTSDGTHFNDEGYKLLSQFMTGQLAKFFGA